MGFFKKAWFWILVAVTAGVGFWIYQLFAPKPPVLTVEPARHGPIRETVSSTGSVAALKKYSLSLEISGTVKEIPVQIGDRVVAGQTLLALDNAAAKNNLAAAEAGYNMALAQLKQVTNSVKREDIFLSETIVKNSETDYQNTLAVGAKSQTAAEADLIAANDKRASANASLQTTLASNAADLSSAYDTLLVTMQANLAKFKQAVVVATRIGTDDFSANRYVGEGDTIKQYAAEASTAISDWEQKLNAADSANPASVEAAAALRANVVSLTRRLLGYIRYAAMEDQYIRPTIPAADRTDVETQQASIDAADSAITAADNIETLKTSAASAEASARATLSAAESAVSVASDKLGSVIQGASADSSRAKSAVAESQAQLNLKLSKARGADVDLALAELDKAKAAVADAITGEEKTRLKAPSDGVVTELDVQVGEVISITTRQNPVLVMITNPPYEIEANVAEVDIARLTLNDPIEITFDAFPDQAFKGKVTEIYPAEEVVSGVIYYRIKANYDDAKGLAKPGMTANLKIVTAEKADAVLVPYASVTREAGAYTIKIATGKSTFQTRPVKIGLQGEVDIEILSGVKVGDPIVTFVK